jgi:hypothetical protein
MKETGKITPKNDRFYLIYSGLCVMTLSPNTAPESVFLKKICPENTRRPFPKYADRRCISLTINTGLVWCDQNSLFWPDQTGPGCIRGADTAFIRENGPAGKHSGRTGNVQAWFMHGG